jgi:pyruvate kinase
MKLIAKIEDEEGVNNIKEILDEVDGVMIARGGLGVELGVEKVPIAQRIITEEAIKKGKLVITATQMLESMTYNPIPTRAEANDVATVVFLGTDAVMLSGETSAGKYPVETVRMIKKIILEAEQSKYYQQYFVNYKYVNEKYIQLDDLIKFKTDNIFIYAQLENDLVDLISYVANLQTKSKIYALISNIELSKQICLFKGVTWVLTKNINQCEDINELKEFITIYLTNIIDTNNQKENTNVLIYYSNQKISYCLV